MGSQLADRILAATAYFFIVGALVSTIILICGCIPSTPGEASALGSFYAVRLHSPGISTQGLRIASFALCVEHDDTASCVVSAGRKLTDSLALLSRPGHAAVNAKAVQIAYSLQQHVIYGTPALASVVFLSSLCGLVISQFFRGLSPHRIRTIAITLAALGTAVALVDAFSTHMVVSALESASYGVVQGFQYEKGIYYMGFQWAAFALGFCGLGTLLYENSKGKAQGPVLPA